MPCPRRRGVVPSHGPQTRQGLGLLDFARERVAAARLADIAAQADVSEATVSRVLNGKPGVAEPTRQAVLTAIDVLGYDRPTRLQAASRPCSSAW